MSRSSKLILSKNIKLDKEYKDVLNYSETNMLNLMLDNTHFINKNETFSFLRPDENVIATEFTYAECLQANYIAFTNPSYANKWFFAFVEDVKYISDKVTEISFTIDVMTTWFNKVTPEQCFVVREHTMDDTIGKNLLPENLETGEYVVNNVYSDSKLANTCICTMLSDDSTTTTHTVAGDMYNGVFSGCKYILNNTNSAGISSLNQILSDYDNAGKNDAVVGIFMCPTGVIEGWNPDSTIGIDLSPSSTPFTWDYSSVTLNSTLNGYTPKNNKLYTGQFNYLAVSNNNGIEKIYNYEFFTNHTPLFKVDVAVCPGCSIKLKPKNYKGVTENELEGIIGGKYPTCSWKTDLFVNWATQNAVNMMLNTAGNIISIAGASSSEQALSGGMGIANTVATYVQHEMVPDSARGNVNCGDVVSGGNKNTFYYYQYSVNYQFAKIIDEYFTRFGYKTNLTKVPNINGRRYFNYVQIADSEVIGYGEVPNKYMDEINKIFRKGVTIWHDHSKIGDYTVNNTIVTP